MQVAQSSIYLAGNKRKLLPSIMPHLLVEGRTTFIDLFGGSGTVTLNVNNQNHFNHIIYNERDEHMFGLQKYIMYNQNKFCIVSYLNEQYSKSKEDYLALRRSYNAKPDYDKLYLLMCRSNSNAIRFSGNGTRFNQPWGDRSPFYPERMKAHQECLLRVGESTNHVQLMNKDFREMVSELIEYTKDLSKVVVYADPPYHATSIATYQEQGGWTKKDNTEFLETIELLISKGVKVVMSNVFENKGKTHTQLINWCEKNKDLVDVHHLDISYNNSSFRKSTAKTDEVLIVSK